MSTKAIATTAPSWFERFMGLAALWLARLVLATLGVAGGISLLGGVDDVIKYPIVGVLVAFLLKETM